jgi:hypothetical protein
MRAAGVPATVLFAPGPAGSLPEAPPDWRSTLLSADARYRCPCCRTLCALPRWHPPWHVVLHAHGERFFCAPVDWGSWDG